MSEVFKPIVGYEGLYEVSSLGRVKSCERVIIHSRGVRLVKEHFVPAKDDRKGYLCVSLWKNNKNKHPKVHRLVAEAFIPNPENLRDVNHIDENRYNNNVDNLEWVSHKDNLNYGTRNKRASNTRSKEVGQFNKATGELIASYKNGHEACAATGIMEQQISQCCLQRKYRKTAGGFVWRFINA